MPRVFITYSHDSNAHIDRVLALADRLRGDGLDVRLDQYELHVPEGWIKWMERQLEQADFVLVVCTETYRRRFDGKEAAGIGLAATLEGALAQQFIYDAGSLNHRFIPIVFEDGEVGDIPRMLGSATRYRLDAAYDDLYRHLTAQPKTPPPPIGKIRPMPPAPRPGLSGTSAPPASTPNYQGATSHQQIHVQGSANNGHATTPASASSPSSSPRPAPAPPAPAKILLVTANASDQAARLLLDEESRAIIDALQRARLRDRYELHLSPAISFDRLVHDLDDHAPPFVHFSGHGDRDGALILQTADRYDHRIPPENIRQLFAALGRRPELVVFATCYSRDLAEHVAPHVGHAIGFTGPLDDGAARHFSAVLYERLAAHDPPDIARAFTLARIATVSAGYPEVDGACLFDQTGRRPDDPSRGPTPASLVRECRSRERRDYVDHRVDSSSLSAECATILAEKPLGYEALVLFHLLTEAVGRQQTLSERVRRRIVGRVQFVEAEELGRFTAEITGELLGVIRSCEGLMNGLSEAFGAPGVPADIGAFVRLSKEYEDLYRRTLEITNMAQSLDSHTRAVSDILEWLCLGSSEILREFEHYPRRCEEMLSTVLKGPTEREGEPQSLVLSFVATLPDGWEDNMDRCLATLRDTQLEG